MPNTDALIRTVFISDNLPFLKSLDTESIDLVVIDPPFGKKQTFTGRLKPPLSKQEREQEQELMVNWGVYDVASAYEFGVEYPDQTGETALFREMWRFERVLQEDWWDAIRETPIWWLIESTRRTHDEDTAAYIAFMAQRMVEVRRILKPTGSVYLHCDHDANAYLRQMMDAVFGASNFLNEITWLRTATKKGNVSRRLANDTDTILRYGRDAAQVIWNTDAVVIPYDLDNLPDKTAIKYRHSDPDGRLWQLTSITSPSQTGDPERTFEVMGVTRTWRWSRERIRQEIDNGRIIQSKPGAVPRYKRYLDEQRGLPLNNLWTDIPNLNSMATERTGYPTQKPQALAQRIIQASSNPGDLVLDCFAGCAYVPVVAEMLGRRWIACDMSPRAWTVVRRQFAKKPELGMTVESEETDYEEASPRFEGKGVLKVRGPNQLPVRSDPEMRLEYLPPRAHLPQIRFRQTPLETSAEIWQAFVDEWGAECWYCGIREQRGRLYLQLDHIVPNRGDGSNDDCWNRALACIACNSDKSNRLTPAQTIKQALQSGRIETERQCAEIEKRFDARHKWAIERWKSLPKPNRFSAPESPDADSE